MGGQTIGTLEIEFSANLARLSADLDNATRSFEKAGDDIKRTMERSMEGVEAAMKKVQSGMLALTAVLAGGEAFKEVVNEALKVNTEAARLGKQFGITATEASVLNMALDDAHISLETFQNAGSKITQQLNKNEDAFQKLGVATRDSNGNFRNSTDIMMDVNARLLEFKEGTDRNIEGVKMYGKSWGEVSAILKLTPAGLEEARKKADELNLTVSQEGLDATKKYRDAMNDVGDVMRGVGKTIGEAVMPLLTTLAEWFASVGPQAVAITQAAIDDLNLAFLGVKTGVEIAWEIIKLFVQEAVDILMRLANTAERALRFDFAGAKAAWKQGGDIMAETFDQAMSNIVSKASANHDKMLEVLAHKKTATKSKEGGANSTGADGGEEGNSKQQQQLAEERINQIKQMNELELAAAAEKYKHAKEMGQINDEQELTAMIAIEDRKYEIDQKALSDRIALHAQEPVEKQKLLDQLQQLEAKHAQEVIKINDQIEVAKQKAADKSAEAAKKAREDEIREYQKMMQPVTQAVDRSVQGMIQGTTTAQAALKNIGQSILGEFINMAVKKTTVWLASEMAQTMATKAAVAENKVAKISEATTTVGANAASAASGAATSQASIPFVGPEMAAASFAMTFSMVEGALSSIPSAAGGFDIPSGMNPLTQLHEKEMVLPAAIAGPLRNMVKGGGENSGGHTFNITAMDSRDVQRALQAGGALHKAITNLNRNFTPMPR